MSYSDETLRQFLEGALTDAETKAIEADMLADRALERRIMALDPLAGAVRETMSAVPTPERIASLTPPVAASRPFARWTGVAAACLLGVGIGAAGMGMFGAEASDWRMEVAHYQALYTTETIARIDASPAEAQAQALKVAAQVGVELPVEALAAVEGLTLVRAQLLGYQGAPLAQIVFADANGAPVALCLIKADGATKTEFGVRQGLDSADWRQDGAAWLLIGGTGAAAMKGHAKNVRTALGV